MEEAIGTRNRNAGYLTTWTGLTRQYVVMHDPRRVMGKRKNRSGGACLMLGAARLVARPNSRDSSARIPMTSILHHVMNGELHRPGELRGSFGQCEGLAKSAEKCPLCTHVFPMVGATIENR